MRIVVISDSHGFHDSISVPECDVLVSAGDISNYGETWEVKNFLTWFGNQKAKHKVFVLGNHEVKVTKLGVIKDMVKEHNKHFFTNIHYLEESEVVIDGIKFWGSPYSPDFFPEHWVWNYPRESGKRRWMGIPNDVDVLITHTPAAGFLDKVIPFGIYDRDKAGCDDLLEKIEEVKPKVHISGHIHKHYGYIKSRGILYVNAAMCDDSYVIKRKPIVIDNWEVVECGKVEKTDTLEALTKDLIIFD